MIKDGTNANQHHEKTSQPKLCLHALDGLLQHKIYYSYTQAAHKNERPSLAQLKNYMRDAYLGLVPTPLNSDNLSKSYAYFGGAQQKLTIEKILSKKELAFNLIPAFEELASSTNFNIENFKAEVCAPEATPNIADLKRQIHLYNLEAITALKETFQNPTIAINALKAVSKKQWGQLLVKAPKNNNLLQATAKLSSDDFFKKGMHIAFLELEPEIYGALTKEASTQLRPGFKSRKYTNLILELELLLTQLSEKQLSDKKNNQEQITEKKSTKEAPPLPTQPTALDLSKNHTTFLEKVVREELGYEEPINRLQAKRILEAANAILKEQNQKETPTDFLHNKHPDTRPEKITYDNMDLSSR